MKVFMFFINTIFWLWLFIVPAGILSFIGYWMYVRNVKNLPYSILLGIAGVALGVLAAERVRKKYGLDNFFARLSRTGDIDNNNPKGKE